MQFQDSSYNKFDELIEQKLQERNRYFHQGYKQFALDYQKLLQISEELEFRNSVLEKEAAELRNQNYQNQQRLEQLSSFNKNNTQSSEIVIEKDKQNKVLSQENQNLVKQKAKLLEELLSVRKYHESDKTELTNQIKLNQQVDEEKQYFKGQTNSLTEEIISLKSSLGVAEQELQHRQAEREKADKFAAQLLKDNKVIHTYVMNNKHSIETKQKQLAQLEQTLQQKQKAILQREQSLKNNNQQQKLFDQQLENEELGASQQSTQRMADIGNQSNRIQVNYLGGQKGHSGFRGCALGKKKLCHQMLSCGEDGCVKVWDIKDQSLLQTIRLQTNESNQVTLNDVAVTCDDKTILVPQSDGAISIIDANTARRKDNLTGHGSSVISLSCNPCRVNEAVSSCGDKRQILCWDLNRGHAVRTIMHFSKANVVEYTNDGQLILTGHYDGRLRVWDAREDKNEAVYEQKLHEKEIISINSLQNSPNQCITAGKDNLLRQTDINQSNKVVQTYQNPNFYINTKSFKSAVDPCDNYLCAGSGQGSFFIWDINKGQLLTEIKQNIWSNNAKDSIICCGFGPNYSDSVVTISQLGSLGFWSINN